MGEVCFVGGFRGVGERVRRIGEDLWELLKK
jgi:hypothetical protein